MHKDYFVIWLQNTRAGLLSVVLLRVDYHRAWGLPCRGPQSEEKTPWLHDPHRIGLCTKPPPPPPPWHPHSQPPFHSHTHGQDPKAMISSIGF